MAVPWHRIEAFSDQFARCAVTAGETAVVLAESDSRPELVEVATVALERLGAAVATVVMPTPANPGPVPIRSTGASLAVGGHRAAIAGLAAADFIVDCTVEGLLHAVERPAILAGGARVLMLSNEHPEVFDRVGHDPSMADRVAAGRARLAAASTMRVTSAAGTDLTVDLAGAVVAGSDGTVTEPGGIAHWPGGLVLCFPAAGTVSGTVVMAPGDANLTFKEYVRTPVTCTLEADHVVDVAGEGLDAELFASYLAAWEESEAYAVSHVGWGMNPNCRWDVLPLYDKADLNGTELRAFAGNFLWSTGANEVAGRFCRGHFDLPMRNCTVTLDGQPVVVDGVLADDLA
jgi:2,5-dihydroxypyridine 5,6-dioxygenase|tara:strand:- start:2715 stop:3752 length:1038 start_codon:yes stop_codon:yes gene_type:complete